jgi:hypothetical protein
MYSTLILGFFGLGVLVPKFTSPQAGKIVVIVASVVIAVLMILAIVR